MGLPGGVGSGGRWRAGGVRGITYGWALGSLRRGGKRWVAKVVET